MCDTPIHKIPKLKNSDSFHGEHIEMAFVLVKTAINYHKSLVLELIMLP